MAGSNNFTIHNPTNANQEPDSTFATDSLTTGGIGTDAILPSIWLNARWYEDSVGFFCLAQAMANKGYTVNKDNPTALEAVLANLITNADLKQPLVAVSYSPTPVFPASTANGFEIILAGNVSSSTFDFTPAIGQILTFVVVQGSAPYTFAPPAAVNGWVPISPIANSVSVQQFIVLEDSSIWPFQSSPNNLATVTGSRSYGTTYQNTSGRPLTVTVTGQWLGNVGHVATMQASRGVSSFSLTPGPAQTVTNGNGWCTLVFAVPTGWYYSVVTPVSSGSSDVALTLTWWEESN